MGWLVFALCALAIGLIYPLSRASTARRKRSRQWNDLRARKQLFASQLRHLQEVTDQRKEPH